MSHDQRGNADRSTRSTKLDHIRRAGLGFGAYIVGIVAATALVGALSAPTAQAQSIYDNAVQIVEEIEIRNTADPSGPLVNYSMDWYPEAVEATEIRCLQSGGQWCVNHAELNDVITGVYGNWAVFVNYSLEDVPVYYNVIYSNDPNATLEFDETGAGLYIDGTIQNIQFRNNVGGPNTTEKGTHGWTAGVDYDRYVSQSDGLRKLFLSTFPVNYPDGYLGPNIPDKPDESVFDQWQHNPENMPVTGNQNCDWWDFSCWSGTVDFNPLRDAAEEAAGNFGFVAQLGGIFSKIVETLTVMPSHTNLPGYDACGSPAAGWCKVNLEIMGGSGEIDFAKFRHNAVMEVVQPWLLLITIGGMAWVIFKSVVGIIERVTSA